MPKLFAVCILFLASCLDCQAADELTFDQFQKLHASLVPENETWKTIPWQTNLLTAQRIAARQKKLIFIWAMDGHPLGCT